MTSQAFEMPKELCGKFNDAILSYWDRPLLPMFLIRGEVKSTLVIQTVHGLRNAESKFIDDPAMHEILYKGGSLVLYTFTTIEEACAAIQTHAATKSRFPFISVRDLNLSDTTPLLKFLEENNIELRMMFDRPECYAEEVRHLLPEL
jgi:hypothetical protein